jgi:hypothetical protein
LLEGRLLVDSKLFLIKSITLLFREEKLFGREHISKNLVSNLLSYVKTSDISIGNYSERDVIVRLKETLNEMTKENNESIFDTDNLLVTLRTNCMHDENLYAIIEKSLLDTESMSESVLKRSITNLIKDLNNFYIEEQIASILSSASYKFLKERDKIKDVNVFLTEITNQLETLQVNTKSHDPAIKSEIDISEPTNIQGIFDEIKKSKGNELVLKTGWHALNRMLQGGIRRGETVFIPALQHKYKTGFTLSIFKQLATVNKPYMLDSTKKPMFLRISFEDDLSNNIEFLYMSLKSDEGQKSVDIKNVPTEEMAAYIKEKLEVNGYSIKMLRVDPNAWSYKHICNKVLELEAQGYEVQVLMLDYLAMVPTVGCIGNGPMGTDLRDMVRRMRNFCGPKKIALITPHQISTQGKALLRSGIDDFAFVKEIAGKGYYSGSSQLDQEIDLEIYIHVVSYQKEHYLTVQRGKHRITTIADEKDQYFILKFPKGMPIPDDIHGEDTSLRSVKSQDSTDELFSFDTNK